VKASRLSQFGELALLRFDVAAKALRIPRELPKLPAIESDAG